MPKNLKFIFCTAFFGLKSDRVLFHVSQLEDLNVLNHEVSPALEEEEEKETVPPPGNAPLLPPSSPTQGSPLFTLSDAQEQLLSSPISRILSAHAPVFLH
jgi:hypothetical protein